jgi:hypothetical protein
MADAELRLIDRVKGKPPVERRVLATRDYAVLEIPATPPSYNAANMARGSHWAAGRKAKREWEKNLGTALMVKQIPRGLLRVEADAMILFKERRRRDPGNFRVILEKALGDCLVAGGWLPDDTADRFEFGQVVLRAPTSVPWTQIKLIYYREENADARSKTIRRAVRG